MNYESRTIQGCDDTSDGRRPRNPGDDWGEAYPKRAANTSRDEGQVESPAGFRPKLLPRVRFGGERGKARRDERHR